jgi:histidine triad (HIT) family protein
MTTIFARIAKGEIPSAQIYADDLTFAFLDIAPASRGHALVIPRDPYPDLLAMPPNLVAAVALTVQRVAHAITAVLQPDGFNIVQNNGTAAGQTVPHYHVHIIPRWNDDGALGLWVPHPADATALAALAGTIRDRL